MLAGIIPEVIPGTVHGKIDRSTERIGLVLQNPEAQMIAPTVEEEIAFGMENQGIAPKIIQRRANEILESFGISHLREKSPTLISGGERQKVSLASVMALNPDVLLLDEPTAYLDPKSTDEFFQLLKRLHSGLSMVIVEHKLEHVYRFMHRFTILDGEGKTASQGSKDEFERSSFLPWSLHHLANPNKGSGSTHEYNHPVIQTKGLYHSYEPGENVLQDVSMELLRGETVTLMGPNGAGKTTLLEKIACLLKNSKDSIWLGETDVTALPAQKLFSELMLLPQNPEHFFLRESVEEEMELAHDSSSVDRASERFQLKNLRSQNPYRLSEGEKRRLTLACSFLDGRAILLMDEPAYGLDYSAYEALVQALRELKSKAVSIILATHSPELAFLVSDRIVFLDNGKVVFSGEPAEMLQRIDIPSSLYLPVWERMPCPKE
jgi:energy-coupling factor transport system ATP-binding protein